MIRGTGLEELTLEDLVRATERNPAQREIHRCAAEVWNHTVYWQSMRPRGGGNASGQVAECIRRRFGSFDRFARDFREAARAHFGSGWLWLVWRRNSLQILTTRNAGTPLGKVEAVLLGLDLWEHAYYLDFQNRRAAYVNSFLEDLVNWDFANRALAQLSAPAEPRTRPAPLPLTQPDLGRLAS
jgi:superoxide dismutase, Fe-Mn family